VLAACLVVLTAAAGTPATEKPRLAVLALTASGVDAPAAEALGDTVTAVAAKAGWFQVTSQKDMQTLLGLERQKQLLGCSEAQSACMAELAGASVRAS